MAKLKRKQLAQVPNAVHSTTSKTAKLSPDLQQDSSLWFRIHVLLYDLCHIHNRFSEARTQLTTDPLYISSPYFSPEESLLIKNTIILGTTSSSNTTNVHGVMEGDPAETMESTSEHKTIQQTIEHKLARFLDKRKAGRDFRPCGPHDMAPTYLEAFGISMAELKSDEFLEKLGRSKFALGGKGKGKEKAEVLERKYQK